MSPILVRPVREQLEHDRVIRLLQAKYKRKFDVAVNPGNEQTTPVGTGPVPWYPDLVLQSAERSRKLLGVVEVETAESVNNLEAMSQWAAFSRLRAPFHLYVPAQSVDTARRLATDLQIAISEIWAYHALGDQLRFTLVHRSAHAGDGRGTVPAKAKAAAPQRPAAASGRSARPAVRRATNAMARPRTGAAKKTKATRGAGARKKSTGAAKTQKRK